MEAVVLFFVSFLLLVTGCVSPGASSAATQEADVVPTLETGATSGAAYQAHAHSQCLLAGAASLIGIDNEPP